MLYQRLGQSNKRVWFMQKYSEDYLLDRRVRIFQPLDGYRASIDAVFLASVIKQIKKGDTILDVGSGTGAISLCLAERFKENGPRITGLELQPELTELSNMSAATNGFENFLSFVNTDIAVPKNCPSPCTFSHVITNPPYSEHDMPSPNPGKAFAHNGKGFSLSGWISFCLKMLRPKGCFYMINRAEAVTEILACLHNRMGAVTVVPLFSKPGQNAKRVIITARKDSKAPAVICPGLTIHNPDGGYTPAAHKILRLGCSLEEALNG